MERDVDHDRSRILKPDRLRQRAGEVASDLVRNRERIAAPLRRALADKPKKAKRPRAQSVVIGTPFRPRNGLRLAKERLVRDRDLDGLRQACRDELPAHRSAYSLAKIVAPVRSPMTFATLPCQEYLSAQTCM